MYRELGHAPAGSCLARSSQAVIVGLKETTELAARDPDAIKPFDGVRRIPAEYDCAHGSTAPDRDRLIVHLVSEEHVVLERLGEGQASGEPMNAFEPVDRTGIRAFEDDLARVGRDADQFEQPGEASAGLSRLGYRAGRPRDAPWGRLEFSATVACAFQDHSQCATLQAPQPVEIERDRSVVAPQLQRPSCGIVCRRGEMAPDEVQRSWNVRELEGCEGRGTPEVLVVRGTVRLAMERDRHHFQRSAPTSSPSEDRDQLEIHVSGSGFSTKFIDLVKYASRSGPDCHPGRNLGPTTRAPPHERRAERTLARNRCVSGLDGAVKMPSGEPRSTITPSCR